MQYWLTLKHWKLRDVESSIWKLDNRILRPTRISSKREFKLSRMGIPGTTLRPDFPSCGRSSPKKLESSDLQAFDELLTAKTRLMILNSPANPTGGVIPRSDLEHIAQAAIECQIWLISDEIFTRLVYDANSVPSIVALPGMTERTVIVDGFSKTFGVTGWRLGYAIMPVSLAERVELLLTQSVGCTATFAQMAGIEALSASQEIVSAMVAEFQHRRDQMVGGLNAIPGVNCQMPLGAFYAFPDVISFNIPVRELASQLLEETGIAVLPGTDFGENGEGYLRLCYAAAPEDISLAIERIASFLGKLVYSAGAPPTVMKSIIFSKVTGPIPETA